MTISKLTKSERIPANAAAFRPELVGLRRRMRSLSQAELAAMAGMTQGTLSKIEQGIKSVNEETAERLAEALACRPEFFFQAEREYGAPMSAHAMFRKKASASQRALDQLIAEMNVRIGHIRKFMVAVDFKPELSFPEYDLDDFGGNPEAVAESLRRAWLAPAGPIRNLTEFAERAGCVVVHCDMDCAKIDGVSYRIPGLPPLIFLNKNQPADRLRFSLAHELGHLVMHRYPSPSMEQEANQFASALLMPAQDIGADLRDLTLERAAYMKPVWKVSMGALIMRASVLKKIDTYKGQYLWRQMSVRGYRLREPDAVSFARETTSLMDALVGNMANDMGYTRDEFAEAMHLHFDELAQMYGLQTPGLRRVK
jgi:Zn-dependent peptidase ImmA (M78 family)/transcriptional regulator with XRE-family HTH domain